MTDQIVERGSTLEALSKERFGRRTTFIEKVTTVSNTKLELLPNNPNRLSYTLINEGGVDIRLSNTPNVTTSSGFLLAANGGIISVTWEEDGETVGNTLYAISAGVASNVRSREVTAL